jgi:hypothetical protein
VSVLRSIEHRIESLVEGVFGRAFRSHVQPVELARKLAKEMDDHKSVSVSRVYVPNEYHLYLAPSDREQFASYEGSLLAELADYLSEHARREGYALVSTPVVRLHEDEDLSVGEFGIATRMAEPARAAAAPAAPQAPPAETRIYKPQATERVDPAEAERLGLAHAPPKLVLDGNEHEVAKVPFVVGRSRDADLTVNDANVSRRHAEIRFEEGAYLIADLGSTNGVEVNGKRVPEARLEDKDRILLGQTELVFRRS